MKCYSPLKAFRTRSGTIAFHEQPGDVESLELPCGRCIGCRLGRAQAWAIRCKHESMLHRENTFITLTYADEHVPPDGSLRYRDFQLFMKRLRRKYSNAAIRFFCAGEYGDTTYRPHYHALLFNFSFSDAEPWGRRTYRSESLEGLWQQGSSLIAPVTSASIAYVARYAVKKVYGKAAEEHYTVTDRTTGEVQERVPEFVRMSLRPGIGLEFFKQYKTDLYPGDFAVMDGRQVPVPSYYKRKLAELSPEEIEEIEYERYLRSRDVPREEKTPERRAVAEKVHHARYNHHVPERGF